MNRRIAKWIVAAVGAFALTPSAQARGIDCAKAATRLDKVICADPQMLEYDGRIAAAYAQALTAWKGAIADYVRRDQMAWLRAFRAIGTADDNGGCTFDDSACIREALKSRVDHLESGSYANSGVYLAADGRKLLLMPRRANGYALRVFRPSDASVVSLDEDRAALWDGTAAMIAKMGDANGLPLPSPTGRNADGCTLRLVPSALAISVRQTGFCGGRDYSGAYRRDLAQTLSDYELELF